MKQSKYVLFGLWLLSVSLQSCLTDEPTFSLEDPIETSESIAIVTVLHAIQNDLVDGTTPCFDFGYPLELSFNTGISISVSNREGLIEAAKNQVTGLHVDGIQFPIIVTKGDDLINIENESEFIDLLIECDIRTLHDDFFWTYANCYEFAYPFDMLDEDSITVSFNDFEEVFDFKRQQSGHYQPMIQFPVEVVVFETEEIFTLNNYFELYQVIDECDGCPSLFFEADKTSDGSYIFEANFASIDRVFSYDWFVNDDYIETDGTGVGGDNRLRLELEPGEYEVCIRTETPDCALGVEYCSLIVVEDPCPDLDFQVEFVGERFYQFFAEFPGMNNIEYGWVVYFEDTFLYYEPEEPGGDNILEFQFGEPGTYEVCLEVEGLEGCPFASECVEIVIE